LRGERRKRAAIYVRVSTDEQSVENQEAELRATAERMGHEIVAVYRDKGFSGAKGRNGSMRDPGRLAPDRPQGLLAITRDY
jgi:predicted site-specific integrase-resolvase